MYILGIDTSCDDTSSAILEDGKRVLSNIVHSQIKVHHPYGGVVPELASREHIRNILPVVKEALHKAGITIKDLDAVAVTSGPGLMGSLLVGLYYGKALSYSLSIPMVTVNHLEGHILSIFLEKEPPAFPYIALTVSGGHTSIFEVRNFGKYRTLGQTLDDAAGEAFDKVAKLLGLGYPGGPIIERLSENGRADAIQFPRAFMGKDSLNFSFSGIKTAVSLYYKRYREDKTLQESVKIEDIIASFQEAVIDVLVQKSILAGKSTEINTIVLAGGVACNSKLRDRLIDEGDKEGIKVYMPSPQYCTDNGAMIALAGYQRIIRGERADLSEDVMPKYPIEKLSSLQ